MDQIVRPKILLLLPLVILLAVAAAAAFILIFARLRVFNPRHAGDDAPARVYVRRGLGFAAVGVAVAIVGRILGIGSRLIVQYIPLAMVALGGLSALRAFLSPAYAGARGPGGIGEDADPGTADAGRAAWSRSGGGHVAPPLDAPGATTDGEVVSIAKSMGTLRFAAAGRTIRGGSLRLGMGNAEVDLAGLRLPGGMHVLRTHVGMGELHIRPPLDVPTRIEADVALGEIRLGTQRDSGIGNRLVREDDGYPGAASRLLIVASVSLGEIRSS